MPLNNLFRKIEALERFNIEKEIVDIINKNGDYITGLLRLQLQEGKDSNNENITIFGRDHYSDLTIFNKEMHGVGLGKQTEWITNYMSGRFYMSLKTTASGRVFKTESDVPYFKDIIARSGDVIMKLNKKHLEEFSSEILIPELRRRFKAMQK